LYKEVVAKPLSETWREQDAVSRTITQFRVNSMGSLFTASTVRTEHMSSVSAMSPLGVEKKDQG
jgi:hypothetical protein